MKKCRSCSLPDRRLLPAKGKLPMCKSTYFLLGLSSHVMLTPAYSVAWKSTIRRGQSMPADWPCLVYALFIPSLCLVYTLFMPSMWVWCDMRSSHVMPTMACAMADIYGCGSFFPFLFSWKKRNKSSRPTSSDLTHKADASPPCRPWPAHSTQSVFGVPTVGHTLLSIL